ncbi:hypothetical protein WDW89_09430 [Deltaproteobacteria bacterium TL4]
MADDSVLQQQILEQVRAIVQKINSGDMSTFLMINAELGAPMEEFVNYVNDHVQNLQQLEKSLPRINKDISRLVSGISDVLQTIEKASIRVLDNTDGILEQHDIIDNAIKLLKQNPAIARVIGKRLDAIQQAQNKSRMFVFDTIQAQEFQELTKKQTQSMIASLEGLKDDLSDLQKAFRLQGDEEEREEEREFHVEAGAAAADQDSVDQLLAEFGL